MKGTYEQAIQYAMTANWKNGLRPKSEDARRSVHMLLSTAPDFGFDSTAVNKWLQCFGIPASTARNHTKDKVEEIKAKRDAEIVRLMNEGLSSREIEAETGISYKTAQRVIAQG